MNFSPPNSAAEHDEFLRTLVRLNQEGIDRLKVKDMRGAVRFFANAVELARIRTNTVPAMDIEEDLAAPSKLRLVSVPLPPLGQRADESILHVHNCAFQVMFHRPTTGDHHQPMNASDTNAIVTAILFNLGLACHSLGMQFQSAQHLQKACNLYNLCVTRMIPRLLPDHHPLGAKTIMTVVCLNNQAQIYYDCWGNVPLAMELATQIQRHVDQLKTSQNGQRLIGSSEVGDILLNAYIMLHSNRITSAAA
ncbi:unknown protein [Seminavis robusta]|uniref:Uncharacterized protein n=1 Tax=Seminavis robusta TaxID=568900 RepID=A0A9N8HIU8_9STRA|nr:unknown protein [Seminavis robusta]|eukprot:Sro618_g176310.1 n/a (250) ;mRNA; f:47484-48233